jgi:hypothetical protein
VTVVVVVGVVVVIGVAAVVAVVVGVVFGVVVEVDSGSSGTTGIAEGCVESVAVTVLTKFKPSTT